LPTTLRRVRNCPCLLTKLLALFLLWVFSD
jgi:hypothetical protein